LEIFCFEPRYEFQTVSGYKVLISQFESGKEQRRHKRRLPREWRLGFADAAEKILELKDFSYNYLAFAYSCTPPGNFQYLLVKATDNILRFAWRQPKERNIRPLMAIKKIF